jgi:hypothetical protein
MNLIRVFTLLFLLSSTGLVFGRDSTELDQAVDRIVIQLKGGDEHAEEYRAARKYHTIELGNPSSKYIVSFFTIESFNGGNNYHFYLALLKSNDNSFQNVDAIEIGGGGYRHVDFGQVATRDNKIVIGTLEYVRDEQNFDANCCPSRKSEAIFELVHGKLHEITRAEPPPNPMSAVFIPARFSPWNSISDCG